MLYTCRQANLFAGEPQRRHYMREALVVSWEGGAQNWCGFRVDGERARDSREERKCGDRKLWIEVRGCRTCGHRTGN